MAKVKIGVVGAGSGQFMLGLISDLCLTPNLHGSTVSLMDVDGERLEDAWLACRRLAEEMRARVEFEKTLDRRECLRGADFVVVSALVGGARRMREGWAIAERLGLRWGGSYHILYDEPFWLDFYQLRLFESVAGDMLELCPRAWMLLISNPVGAGTTLLTRRYPGLKMVGLCHGYAGVYEIADVLGLEREALSFDIPGINHFVWLTRLEHRGEDVFPMIEEWLETRAEEHWRRSPEGTMGRKKMDLYRKLGAIPIGDTAGVTGGSWPWWYHSDPEVERRWGTDARQWWQDYIEWVGEGAERLRQLARERSEPLTNIWGKAPTGEAMVPFMEAVACDAPRELIEAVS